MAILFFDEFFYKLLIKRLFNIKQVFNFVQVLEKGAHG